MLFSFVRLVLVALHLLVELTLCFIGSGVSLSDGVFCHLDNKHCVGIREFAKHVPRVTLFVNAISMITADQTEHRPTFPTVLLWMERHDG